MSTERIWHHEKSWAPFEKLGIYAGALTRSDLIAEYYRDKRAAEHIKNAWLKAEVLDDRIRSSYARRLPDGTWEISDLGLQELAAAHAEDKRWISSTGLDTHGISNTVDVCEILLQRYADSLRKELTRKGYDEDAADNLVEKEAVRRGRNAVRNQVWQLHRNKLDEFKQWLVEESKFVSVTDAPRMIDLKVRSTRHGLSHILPDMQSKEIAYRTEEGASQPDAAVSVERECCRMGFNFSNENVWQFHEGYAPAIIHRLEFISAHNAKTLGKDYQITAHVDTISKAVENIYNRHLEEAHHEVAPGACPKRNVEENIALFGSSRKGNQTWLIHPDYMDELRAEIPKVIDEQKKWTSASALSKHRIIVPPETANLALAYLFEKMVKRKMLGGLGKDEAKAEISAHEIRLSYPKNKAPIWEIHESCLGDLRELLTAPRSDWIDEAWKLARREARQALNNGSGVGSVIDVLGDRMRSGRGRYERTWAERVMPRSKMPKAVSPAEGDSPADSAPSHPGRSF